jgi:dTDP-4-dehydrorhamnose 3,5-epimerase
MGKLMTVTRGVAFMVTLDIRRTSPTFGKYITNFIAGCENKSLWAPAGFARGYCAIVDDTEVTYRCDADFNQKSEGVIRWNDKALDIDWPVVGEPILSYRDKVAPCLEDSSL